MRWSALVVVATVAASCRCGPPATQTPIEPLRVSPTALAFGDTWVGARKVLAFEVTNPNRVSRVLAFSFAPPFSGPPEVELAGGTTAAVTVAFAPTAPGEARASVTVDDVEVTLRGVGLAPLDCGSAPCEERRFDPDTGECRTRVMPDGSACSVDCLAAGQCAQGRCVGAISTQCDSKNACIIDGCGLEGCVHVPRDCPVTDPCQAVYCDPQLGCRSQPVEDGLPCGEATCETAEICLGGQCQRRVRPDALQNCRYVELASGTNFTCGVTRGGLLRCWGGNQGDLLGRGYSAWLAAPGSAPAVSGGVHVTANALDRVWVARTSGEVERVGRRLVLPLPAAESVAVGGSVVCGLEQGEVACRDTTSTAPAFFDGGVFTAAQGVSALSMTRPLTSTSSELCLVADGGVSCGLPWSLAPVALPEPASAVVAVEHGFGCARTVGSVVCWGPDSGATVVWDAGVTALASSALDFSSTDDAPEGRVCAAMAAGVECADFGPSRSPFPGRPRAVPQSDLGAVRQLSLGRSHGCLLLDDGRVGCWGSNAEGQLGDRSPQPLGLHLLPFRAGWMSGSTWGPRAFAEADGGGVFFLLTQQATDGGVTWRSVIVVDAGMSRDDFEARCVTADGGSTSCGGVGPLPTDVAPVLFVGQMLRVVTPTTDYSVDGVCAADALGVVRCFVQAGGAGREVRSLGGDAGAPLAALECVNSQCQGYCAVRRDGQVRCFNVPATQQPPSGLSDVAHLCGDDGYGGGCALRTTGELQCWGAWVGSPRVAVRAPGAWPVVREVSCGTTHFCALSGSNIVQCWGDNLWGQLGRDGPPSTQAVSVPMPEPVRHISAKSATTCALLQSGRVVCWGDNQAGVLGVPALMQSERPLLVTQ